jgi:hypothetical protein
MAQRDRVKSILLLRTIKMKLNNKDEPGAVLAERLSLNCPECLPNSKFSEK